MNSSNSTHLFHAPNEVFKTLTLSLLSVCLTLSSSAYSLISCFTSVRFGPLVTSQTENTKHFTVYHDSPNLPSVFSRITHLLIKSEFCPLDYYQTVRHTKITVLHSMQHSLMFIK